MVQKWIEDVSFMAHGYCLLWDPKLLFVHAASDLVIALCYFAIPLGIWYYLKQRPDIEMKGLAWLFVAFIFLCGLTHLIALITLWNPIYITQGTVKFFTAGASIVTAITLVQIMPKALAIPSPAQLQAVNSDLMQAIDAHQVTLKELQQAKANLEERVAERTKELEHAKRQFQQLFEESPAAMLMTDSNGTIERANAAAEDLFDYPDDEAVEKNIHDLVPEFNAELVSSDSGSSDNLAHKTSARTGPSTNAKTKKGKSFPAEVRANSMNTGSRDYLIVSVFDVSERVERQKQIELLMAEVNHRANNLLSVVQTVARQTARESSGEEFADTLIKRLQSLSTSQDLIIRGDWTAVELEHLVKRHLSFLGDLKDRCAVEGPSLKLTPQAAQGIGMAVHELATNSIKYGALSNDKGKIDIKWDFKTVDDRQSFEIVWHERKGPKVKKPTRRGFGNTVIERMAASAVGGKVVLEYEPSGLVWRLTAPTELSTV